MSHRHEVDVPACPECGSADTTEVRPDSIMHHARYRCFHCYFGWDAGTEPSGVETAYTTRYPVAVSPDDDPLFRQTGEDEYECTVCGAVDAIEDSSMPGMAGGTDSSERCTACGSYEMFNAFGGAIHRAVVR